MLNRNMIKISVFILKEEEKCTLAASQRIQEISSTITDLHFMHNSGNNQEALVRILQRMLSAWNGYSVLLIIHVSVYDMILTAYEDTGWTVESVRRSELSAWNLNQKVGPRIRRLTPFAYDVIETEIKLIICQHLESLSVGPIRTDRRESSTNLLRTFRRFSRWILVCFAIIHF
jgi:hypothetical protein